MGKAPKFTVSPEALAGLSANTDSGQIFVAETLNVIVINNHTMPNPPGRAWYERWWGIILLGLAVTVVGGGAIFFFGWN